MATTVVAVVVFLCGVLVGRGVPLGQAMTGRGLTGPTSESRFGAGPGQRSSVVSAPSGAPSAAALAGDDLTYSRRLDGAESSTTLDRLDPGEIEARRDRLGQDAPTPVSDDPDSATELVAAPGSRPPGRPEDASSSRAAGPGGERYTVQVTAVRERAAAQRVADGLVEKGYPAFVAEPLADAPVAVFRVRVGQYADRAEAERIQRRLEREEQLKPWITR